MYTYQHLLHEMSDVLTVIYQETYNAYEHPGSSLKQCICSFRNNHSNEQPEPEFLPPKTKERWWTLSAFATAVKDALSSYISLLYVSTWLNYLPEY